MSLPSDTVTDDVKQLLLEDPAKNAWTNSTEGTSDSGDNNPINLNSMSLNKATALMQKAFNFQGTADPTMNNNSTPQPDLKAMDTTGSAAREEDEMLQEVFQEFGKTGIKGPLLMKN